MGRIIYYILIILSIITLLAIIWSGFIRLQEEFSYNKGSQISIITIYQNHNSAITINNH